MLLGLQNVTFEFGARVIVALLPGTYSQIKRIGLLGTMVREINALKSIYQSISPLSGTVEKERTLQSVSSPGPVEF